MSVGLGALLFAPNRRFIAVGYLGRFAERIPRTIMVHVVVNVM